jgi:hypothetical protein
LRPSLINYCGGHVPPVIAAHAYFVQNLLIEKIDFVVKGVVV